MGEILRQDLRFDNFTNKKAIIISIIFLIVNLLIIGITFLSRPKYEVTGNWIAKTDSTQVLFVLEDNKTGEIELEAKNEIYKVEIKNYNIIKTDSSITINVLYGEQKEYPTFFYNIKKFEVEKLMHDSLYLYGNNVKSSWRLRLERK